MRSIVAALVLLLGVSAASAQGIDASGSGFADETRKTCDVDGADINSKFSHLRGQITTRPPVFTPEDNRTDRRIQTKITQLGVMARLIVRSCLALHGWIKRAEPGPPPPALLAQLRDTQNQVGQAKSLIAEIEKLYPFVLAVGLTGLRYTIFSEFGWPISVGDRRFPDFSQTLGRDGDWYGGFGGSVDMPFGGGGSASNFWLTVALMAFYLSADTTEVRNDTGGAPLVLTGNDLLRGAALMAGVGGRLWPGHPSLSRFEWQALGGIGFATNSLRGVGPAGNEQFSGSERVTPWIGRFALYYAITDNWKASLALTAITTPEITGRLSSGSTFRIGDATNLMLMIGLAYAFGSSSGGAELPPLRY